jgi:hypothetical protein
MGSDNSLGQHVGVAAKWNGQEGVRPQEWDTLDVIQRHTAVLSWFGVVR